MMIAPPWERYIIITVQYFDRSGLFIRQAQLSRTVDEFRVHLSICLIYITNMLSCSIITCTTKLGLGILYCSAFSMLRSSLFRSIPNAWHLAQDLRAFMDGTSSSCSSKTLHSSAPLCCGTFLTPEYSIQYSRILVFSTES